MLSLEERLKAIEILVNCDKNRIHNSIYVNGQCVTMMEGLLRMGFGGYASMGDEQLIRCMQKAAKEHGDYNAQSFISSLAFDKVFLGG